MGAGEGIRRARTPIPLAKWMAHAFTQAPDHYGIEGALRWGQVHGLGGDARLSDAVVATRLGRSFENGDFWVTVIRFLVAQPLLHRRHVGPIVDYLQNQPSRPGRRSSLPASGSGCRPLSRASRCAAGPPTPC